MGEKNPYTCINLIKTSILKLAFFSSIFLLMTNKLANNVRIRDYNLPFKPSPCIKASFYILENGVNFSTANGFRRKISMNLVYQYMTIFVYFFTPMKSFHPLQIKQFATSMVNSGLKGLTLCLLITTIVVFNLFY